MASFVLFNLAEDSHRFSPYKCGKHRYTLVQFHFVYGKIVLFITQKKKFSLVFPYRWKALTFSTSTFIVHIRLIYFLLISFKKKFLLCFLVADRVPGPTPSVSWSTLYFNPVLTPSVFLCSRPQPYFLSSLFLRNIPRLLTGVTNYNILIFFL